MTFTRRFSCEWGRKTQSVDQQWSLHPTASIISDFDSARNVTITISNWIVNQVHKTSFLNFNSTKEDLTEADRFYQALSRIGRHLSNPSRREHTVSSCCNELWRTNNNDRNNVISQCQISATINDRSWIPMPLPKAGRGAATRIHKLFHTRIAFL